MDEYIEREVAISKSHGGVFYIDDIKEIPAADVAPVRHGRWIDKKSGFWEVATCSNCGENYPTVGIVPNYCPNCGARMDLEGEYNDTN